MTMKTTDEGGTVRTMTSATVHQPAEIGPGVAAANLHLIGQGVELLARLDAGVYAAPPPVPMGTIGGHFRHCLEFFERFLAGLESGRIDYDRRERDPRVEVDPLHARERLAAVAERLRPTGRSRRSTTATATAPRSTKRRPAARRCAASSTSWPATPLTTMP
jgi:hypothetical protein